MGIGGSLIIIIRKPDLKLVAQNLHFYMLKNIKGTISILNIYLEY